MILEGQCEMGRTKNLFQLYRARGTDLAKALREIRPTPKLSLPLLIDPAVGDYLITRPRWIAVGQETNGWGHFDLKSCVDAWVTTALGQYRDFHLGQDYIRSPFWAANYRIMELSTGKGSNHTNFLWTNLVKFDEDGRRPSEQLEQVGFETFNLLPSEIEILAPDAVIFFVGPRYETRLNQIFPGMQYEQLAAFSSELVYRCKHPDLPTRSFWTYHPNYLRRSRNWAVVEKLGHLIHGRS